MDQESIDNISIFTCEHYLDHAITTVGPSEDWVMILPKEDKSICSKYDGCIVPIHECLFSLIGFHIPFNDLKVEVFNYLLIAPLQLNQLFLAYIKVFCCLCEYKKSVLTTPLFLHLFKSQCSFVDSHGATVSYLSRGVPIEVYYEGVKHLKDHHFLVTPSTRWLMLTYAP